MDVVTARRHTSASVVDDPTVARMGVFGLQPVEIGERLVYLDESLIESLFDQRLGKFGRKAQEQKKFATEFVFAQFLE